MSIASSALKTAVFTLFVPIVVAGVVPQSMVRREHLPLSSSVVARVLGSVLMAVGIAGYVWCATLFVRADGTPAPIAPTRTAVVSGPYRINRNPMYTSVLAVILGQAVLYGARDLVFYGLLMIIVAHVFVLTYEEPTLRRKFDGEYEEFCRRVPRWIPRMRG